MKRYIVIELLDHTSDAEAEEFAEEINRVFQPHFDAKVAQADLYDPEALQHSVRPSEKGMPSGSKIVARYFTGDRWAADETNVVGVLYEVAARKASDIARELDRLYGDTQAWTVDLVGASGSYFQLFHGRLS